MWKTFDRSWKNNVFVRMHKIISMVRKADYTPYCQKCNKYKSGVSVIHKIKESNVGRRY